MGCAASREELIVLAGSEWRRMQEQVGGEGAASASSAAGPGYNTRQLVAIAVMLALVVISTISGIVAVRCGKPAPGTPRSPYEEQRRGWHCCCCCLRRAGSDSDSDSDSDSHGLSLPTHQPDWRPPLEAEVLVREAEALVRATPAQSGRGGDPPMQARWLDNRYQEHVVQVPARQPVAAKDLLPQQALLTRGGRGTTTPRGRRGTTPPRPVTGGRAHKNTDRRLAAAV